MSLGVTPTAECDRGEMINRPHVARDLWEDFETKSTTLLPCIEK